MGLLFHRLVLFLNRFKKYPYVRQSAVIYPEVEMPRNTVVGEYSKLKGKIKIGQNVFISDFCHVCTLVEIGDNTRICRCVDIVSGIPERFQKGRKDFEVPTIIGKNVYLGHQAIVYAGVKVGDNAIVYHGAVVQKDVPSGAIVKGNPAKVVGWVGKKV
jgi:acetyltransferase-like isoleucine patch superfamily enzyme